MFPTFADLSDVAGLFASWTNVLGSGWLPRYLGDEGASNQGLLT